MKLVNNYVNSEAGHLYFFHKNRTVLLSCQIILILFCVFYSVSFFEKANILWPR